MMLLNKLSVVIRTTGTKYKLKYLEKLLQSLANQTFKDYELVVVTESNGQVVEELVRKYIRGDYRVIETGFWNRCKTTNYGIRSSHGEYVILLDDDYILDNNYIKELLELIQKVPEKIACVGSDCKPIYKEALKYRSLFAKILENLSLQGSLWRKKAYKLSEYLIITIGYGGTHAICRRKAIFQVGLYDEELNEPLIGDDLSLALKLYSKGYLNGVYSKVTAYHLEKYVSKQLKKNSKYYESVIYSEIYTCAKYFEVIGWYVFPQMIYRILWALVFCLRNKDLMVIIRGIKGALLGLMHGLLRRSIKLRHE